MWKVRPRVPWHPPLKNTKIPKWTGKTATVVPIYSNSNVLKSSFAGEEARAGIHGRRGNCCRGFRHNVEIIVKIRIPPNVQLGCEFGGCEMVEILKLLKSKKKKNFGRGKKTMNSDSVTVHGLLLFLKLFVSS